MHHQQMITGYDALRHDYIRESYGGAARPQPRHTAARMAPRETRIRADTSMLLFGIIGSVAAEKAQSPAEQQCRLLIQQP